MTDLNKLSKIARQARDNAYCPYSDHPVGVAIVSESGKIYAGANSETAHFRAICAEGAAIAAMITAGDRKIREVAVIGPKGGGICAPCGDCRQRLREFSDAKTIIHALKDDGTAGKKYKIKDLLPDAFGPDNLPKNKKKK